MSKAQLPAVSCCTTPIARLKGAAELASVFKALADETRLRILALLRDGEVCVCHIQGGLQLPQPTISRHLAYLAQERPGRGAARRDLDALPPVPYRLADREAGAGRGPARSVPLAHHRSRSRPARAGIANRAVTTVLFACVHNAGRSQMAAAWFNAEADPEKARAISAGTSPAAHVHPEVIDAMREAGIDLSGAIPQRLTPDLAGGAQWLITMGCGDECPVVPGVRRDDWPVEDPKGKSPAGVRAIRDEIHERVRQLVTRSEWTR